MQLAVSLIHHPGKLDGVLGELEEARWAVSLIHHPGKLDGVLEDFRGERLAFSLIHHPDKLDGVWDRADALANFRVMTYSPLKSHENSAAEN